MQTDRSDFKQIGELISMHGKIPVKRIEESADDIMIGNKGKPFSAWQADFGVPYRSRECSFLNYETRSPSHALALEVAQHMAKEICGGQRREVRPRIFCGTPGTGKTHLACAIIGVALRAGKVSKYLTASDIARSVRSSYSRGAEVTEETILARNVAVPFLVIDEVGIGLGSAHEIAMIHDTITKRYEAMAPTLLISNLSQKELADYLGERIMDRFREDNAQLVEFLWTSERREIMREKIAATV